MRNAIVVALILCIPSLAWSAESRGLKCGSWNQMSSVQKQFFMVGFSEGIIAGLSASDVPDTKVDQVLSTVWPGSSSVESVVAQMDVACRQEKNRDESVGIVMFGLAAAARKK